MIISFGLMSPVRAVILACLAALPLFPIAGGRIGGLARARELARRGHSIVLELADNSGKMDAGIQLGPNGFHALDHLGVGGNARAMAVFIDRLRLDGRARRHGNRPYRAWESVQGPLRQSLRRHPPG